METPYWKQMETHDTFKEWKEFYDGCLMCGCDHGCNQWIVEQRAKIALFFRVLGQSNSTTGLNKLAKMPLKRANAVFYWLHWRDIKRWNREYRG